jgi:tRNA-uridine 2-sulfurtransferase
MSRCVVVAMSGGVDSSVSAAMLRDRGDEVIGVGLRFPDAADDGGAGTCCGMAGMEDARRVAALLDIPFYVLDYRDLFDQEVIAPFCRAYARGETPNPCVLCNIRLKFGRLLDAALAMGADYVATGHYARLEPDPDGGPPRLLKGLDQAHDQSYFLYALTAYQRQHALFPVGELTKSQVRAIAARLGLPVAEKPGSQDICFVGQEGYRALVAAREPGAQQPGPILDDAGRVLGFHRGLAGFTLGQRRGLGIAAKERLYVTALDPARNAVIVGPQAETLTSSVTVDHVNWLIEDVPREPQYMAVKARYRGPTVVAEVRAQGEQARVTWATPQPRVAAGQAVVFFHGDRVLGGGIARAASATESHLIEIRESAYV